MDAATMVEAFGCTRARADRYVAAMNVAMLRAECTTVRRAAMWCAQVGHETLSLIYQREIADGKAYEGRRDLGNTVPGDGVRFPGRGWIQLTGRNNYGAFSRWCHQLGLVPTPDYFVQRPELVEQAPWSGLAASWYWTVARRDINALSDRGDVDTVTRRINGGTNGLADRRKRYAVALRLGDRLLPTPTTPEGDEFDMASLDDLRKLLREEIPTIVWHHPIPDWYTPAEDTMPAFAAMAWSTAHGAFARADVAAMRAELGTLRAALGKTAATPGGQPLTPDAVRQLLVEALREVGPLYLAAKPAA